MVRMDHMPVSDEEGGSAEPDSVMYIYWQLSYGELTFG